MFVVNVRGQCWAMRYRALSLYFYIKTQQVYHCCKLLPIRVERKMCVLWNTDQAEPELHKQPTSPKQKNNELKYPLFNLNVVFKTLVYALLKKSSNIRDYQKKRKLLPVTGAPCTGVGTFSTSCGRTSATWLFALWCSISLIAVRASGPNVCKSTDTRRTRRSL